MAGQTRFRAALLVAVLLAANTACGFPRLYPRNHIQGLSANSSEDVAEDSPCPRIVSREEWGAREPLVPHENLTISPVPYVVVHHGGLQEYCFDEKTCAAIVRSYQDLHMDTNGWDDIGYNFLVGEDGNAYEGRGWDATGAHAPGYNQQSIGICVIGDFSDRLPNDAAMETLQNMMACGVSLGKVSDSYLVLGHRQVKATLCPGDQLYAWVTQLPNWTDDPQPCVDEECPDPPVGSRLRTNPHSSLLSRR
ncbi:peptidoglycan-recognition protein 1-like [Schistocerca cancellata]|uniref:peptidoglycan-recognition protein 1-like n=1 Tax=Schistocerca cancellata TaxID=274614 RepID=UPI0021191F01|nr:peptidoglycan-recognition protein 1-like [Schistocerca cancellata]